VTDASPSRKDVFVEVDAMTGRNPTPAALAKVVAAFDTAPVAAPPGGLPGIRLHVVRDEMGLALRPYPSPFVEFQADKTVHFGTPAERAGAANWAAKREAKAKAYRYCIFADEVLGGPMSGIAEGFGCNDFIVSLGAFGAFFGVPAGTDGQQTGTFMHELGHAMGLHHGGTDDITYKPNYYSVMNYLWQLPKPYNPEGPGGTWEPVFSDRVSPPLLESALSETAGVGDTYTPARFPFSVPGGTGLCPGGPDPCRQWGSPLAGDPVDWNGNGVIDGPLVAVNINTESLDGTNIPADQLLTSHEDWSHLVYNFRGTPHYADGAPPVDIGAEMTLPEHLRLYIAPPPGPATCTSDFNGDGDFGTDADIEAFFACLGGDCCGTCFPGGADFNGDGDIGTDADIEAFFRVLGGGSC
jgi:hypothetical protein